MTAERTCLAVVLAAGEGTRMHSSRPKVMHAIAGQSLLAHTLAAVRGRRNDHGGRGRAGGGRRDRRSKADFARCGILRANGAARHGARGICARSAIARGPDDILVMFADTPLVTPHTLRRMRAALAQGAALVVLGFRPAEPQGYGRIVMAGGEAVAIREELDAGSEERKIDLCNAGLMAFAGATALAALDRIGSDNRKGEFYSPMRSQSFAPWAAARS